MEEESEEKWAPKKKKAGKFIKEALEEMKEETSVLREEAQSNSSTLEECKTMLQELMVVNKFISLPPSVFKLVSDAFKCKICLKAPMIPTIIATRCAMSCLAAAHVSMSGTVGMEDLIKVAPIVESHRVMPKVFSSTELMIS